MHKGHKKEEIGRTMYRSKRYQVRVDRRQRQSLVEQPKSPVDFFTNSAVYAEWLKKCEIARNEGNLELDEIVKRIEVAINVANTPHAHTLELIEELMDQLREGVSKIESESNTWPVQQLKPGT